MVKIERSYPAPESLSLKRSYREKDVIERLRQDFHDKCYICGLDKPSGIHVEHLLPHKNGKYPEREYDWDNLFLSCSHCNSIKANRKYDSGIIDCCKVDPEEQISFRFEDETVCVSAKDETDRTSVLTADLVNEVFSQTNTGIRTYETSLRLERLNMEMNKLYQSVENLRRNPSSKYHQKKVQALLRRESGFAAFKREYARINLKEVIVL